jgi:hypothetical protein
VTIEMSFGAGEVVAAGYRGSHTGVVLDRSDPRAWTDTLAFPGRSPSAEEVRNHLDHCTARGLSFDERVPIRWCFGMTEWERVAGLGHSARVKCRCLHGAPAS